MGGEEPAHCARCMHQHGTIQTNNECGVHIHINIVKKNEKKLLFEDASSFKTDTNLKRHETVLNVL